MRTANRSAIALAALSFGLAPLLSATPAHAGQKECISAADEGQKLRDDGKLTTAREKFITCAAKACPNVIAKQCSQWLLDAEHDMPTLTFRALDDDGKETFAVKVVIDNVTVAPSIEARALSVDPGEHVIRFERADGKAIEEKVLVRPGEKNRMIELSFQPKAPPVVVAPKPVAPPTTVVPDENHGFQIPLLGWVGLGVGVAGGAMTAIFAISANGDESDLRSTCAPSCDPSKKSGIDTKVALANVGFAVGVVGLGVAVVSTVLANTGKPAEKKPDPGTTTTAKAVSFDIGPGTFLVHGAF
ncbi:MAG: uncharacterized protein JWP87_3320 [Labilithrix sp.]|nr:uncharacterized protein [Labilithrix sp.]